MLPSASRPLVALAFSFLLAPIVACGGAKQEAKAPTTDAAELPRDGSSAPDPTPAMPTTAEAPKSEPVKTSAVSNTNDGSDIIPPFTATKDPDKKSSAGPAKQPKKKAQAKPKKKT